MANPYRKILQIPGTFGFSMFGLIARFPNAMIAISIVIMIEILYGSYALAGRVSASYTIALAIGAPQVAKLVDRFGQARVMRPAIAMASIGLLTLTVSAQLLASEPWLYLGAVIAGACNGSMGSMVRARWGAAVRTPAELHTAYSLESVWDELVFILGPILATILTTTVSPIAGISVAIVFLLVGGYLLMGQISSEPTPNPVARKSVFGSVLRMPGMWIIIVVFMSVGAIFGATDVSTIAFTEEHGRPELAGVVLAVFACGSLVSGLAYGILQFKSPLWRRFVTTIPIIALGTILFYWVTSIPILSAVMFCTGLAIAPSIITGNALVQRFVPAARLTEGLTWVGTALNVGVSAGAMAAGAAIDVGGSHSGFFVVIVCACACLVVVLLSSPWLKKAHDRTGQ